MLANILVKPGLIELREVETPSPSRGEILVRVMAALTCGTDLKAFRRGHPVIPMPGVFGHEFSGVVADIGSGLESSGQEMKSWLSTAPLVWSADIAERSCIICAKTS